MLKNKNILCISSIDWDFVWQGHQEIMATFAREGNRVLFIENTGVRRPRMADLPRLKKRIISWVTSVKGFRQEEENLYVYAPLIIPLPNSKICRFINRFLMRIALNRWMKVMGFYHPVIWTFLPTGTALDIIKDLEHQLLVYYCIADFEELVDNPKAVARLENQLITACDVVFVQGEIFKKKCKKLNSNVHIFPFGVNTKVFRNFKAESAEAPLDIKNIPQPIIGYIGGIHKHVDLNLLCFLAERNPEWSIVLVGPEQVDLSKIKSLKNVFLLGKKDFPELPQYVHKFDVGIIPYERNPYTETVYPTKLNEYHAMGKPAVSTAMPEIKKFNRENNNIVFIGNTHEEFEEGIRNSLIPSDTLVQERIVSSEKNSWNARIEQMSDLMEVGLYNRQRNRAKNWQTSLTNLFKFSRKKFLHTFAYLLLTVGIIFYTPAIWYIASPLKIAEPPQKADCIVVFAGGVGESGMGGQGYEERVKHAVDLYEKGFSKKIIFSSGFMYMFQEPVVMKALAIALGVVEKDIILEKKAANTFENVQKTLTIMKKQKWDSALVVSSPYHMKRVDLVYKKIAPRARIILTPVPKSIFYGDQKHVQLKHIRGILHEYLGIIYYWWKGRI